MATLRELRKQAINLGLKYEKDTSPEQLQELITEKLIELDESPAEVSSPPAETAEDQPKRTPVKEEPNDDDPPETSFGEDVEINEDNLSAEFINQSKTYFKYARIEAQAKAKVMSAKLRLEIVDAEMTKTVREQLVEEGAAKPTEKMIASKVLTSKQYKAAMQSLIDATRNADIAKGMKESFQQRRDMLIQLGTTKRQEMDQIGLSIREKAKAAVNG